MRISYCDLSIILEPEPDSIPERRALRYAYEALKRFQWLLAGHVDPPATVANQLTDNQSILAGEKAVQVGK